MSNERMELAGLTVRVVGPADAQVTCVLLHGFGAPGDDLVPLAQMLRAPVRFVFPEAPLELGGLYGDSRAPVSSSQARAAPAARAWWLLDLVKLEQELRAGSPRDRRGEVPDGLPAAREQVLRLLDQVKTRLGAADDRIVLGGFSQGAMVSIDVALHRDAPLAGLVLMSGTLLAESEWQPRMHKLAGVPVLQSHGRNDMLLPFTVAEALRDRMREAGAKVEWHQFVGGHEIPPAVLQALRDFLLRSAER